MLAGGKNCYEILGVAENADFYTIKRAYRKFARQYHPDVSLAEKAKEKFQEIGIAYAVVSDPGKRAQYDKLLRVQGGADLGAHFSSSADIDSVMADVWEALDRMESEMPEPSPEEAEVERIVDNFLKGLNL